MEADLQGTLHHDYLAVSDQQALTLLEFLVKNGSERVVDDARAHVSTIKMLRSFHYIDEKGKDQGINGQSFPRIALARLTSSAKSSVRDCHSARRRRKDSTRTTQGQSQQDQVRGSGQ